MSSKNQPPVFESASESYTSQGILGEGATSIVYRAADSDGKQWALKSLRPEQTTTGRVKRFLNELNFCRIDVHKNVIRVVDHGFSLQEGKKCPFYIMPCYSSTLQKT